MNAPCNSLHFLSSAHELHIHHVDTGISICLNTLDCLLHPEDWKHVGARDDEGSDVGACRERNLQPGLHFSNRHNIFDRCTVPMGNLDVLNVNCCRAGALEQSYRSTETEGATESRINIDDHRQRADFRHYANPLDQLAERRVAQVGHTTAARDATACAVESREPCLLRELCGKPIEYAWCNQNAVLSQQVSQPFRRRRLPWLLVLLVISGIDRHFCVPAVTRP